MVWAMLNCCFPATAAKTNSFNTNPGCKFCGMSNHSSVHCKRFGNYPDRLARVKELNRCSLCLSTKHEEASCLGKTNKLPYKCHSCGQLSHVTPMCPSPQLSFSANKVTSKGEGGRR